MLKVVNKITKQELCKAENYRGAVNYIATQEFNGYPKNQLIIVYLTNKEE